MMAERLTFIGGGNMSRSLIIGLIHHGMSAEQIHVVEPSETQRQLLKPYGVHTYAQATADAMDCQLLVLAVKPQIMATVAQDLQPHVQQCQPLIVSVAAGIRCDDLDRWLGGNMAIVRTMPNTPALVQSGASGLFANTHVSSEQKNLAESVMRAVGLSLWVEKEELLDAVTAVSGSGPAYYLLMMEAMTQAGCQLGLDEKTAQLLTIQTAFGAAKMALESELSPAELRAQVTSPNGTTAAAIAHLQQQGYEILMQAAMQAASNRAKELADEFGKI